MKHISCMFLVFLSLTIAAPHVLHAKGLTVSFGGRVYLAPISGVTCIGTGTSTITSENTGGAVQTAQSHSTMDTLNGIYKMIPVYTTDPSKAPRVGKWILGRKKLIPDISTCSIGNVPIPVLRTTENYGVSK
jgi:hypothetical protein